MLRPMVTHRCSRHKTYQTRRPAHVKVHALALLHTISHRIVGRGLWGDAYIYRIRIDEYLIVRGVESMHPDH